MHAKCIISRKKIQKFSGEGAHTPPQTPGEGDTTSCGASILASSALDLPLKKVLDPPVPVGIKKFKFVEKLEENASKKCHMNQLSFHSYPQMCKL